MGMVHLMPVNDTGIQRFRPAIYGVLRRESDVLLVRAPQTSDGIIAFPGGGIELGEAPLDALRREFSEETGLEIEPLRLLWATTGFHRSRLYPQLQVLGIYWEVRTVGGVLRPEGNDDDVDEAFFWPLRDLPVGRMMSVDREVVQLLTRLLQS
jgi:8-oxo-dGTP pyrophosphatase MutT (NUDIX family)